MKDSPYHPIEAEVQDIVAETAAIKTLILKTKDRFSFMTGQFVELSLSGTGEAPFTPSSDPNISERFEVTVMNAGRVTALIQQLKKGDSVGIRGPYGKGYPLDEFKEKNILIVGGGVGLAPLRSLILALLAKTGFYKRLYLRYGAKTPQDIMYKDRFADWQKYMDIKLTVDKADGSWNGHVGVVTSLLDDFTEIRNTATVVCGPPIMMKFTVSKLMELGFRQRDIYLSMEKNMCCGLGKCGHCRVGRYYVCKDGPVFNYGQLKDIPDIWD